VANCLKKSAGILPFDTRDDLQRYSHLDYICISLTLLKCLKQGTLPSISAGPSSGLHHSCKERLVNKLL
jgi:hypothetical protein